MGRLNAEDRSLICNLRTYKGWGELGAQRG